MNDEQTPALREAVENMATMRQAYDSLSQAAEAYNTGKTELAANITAKGVQASATETLPELAEKVSAIAQENYTIDGGEMYANQLFGSLETLNYWNLYEVLANLLSDGRLVSYGGILLAEYYRGYDSLALAGAGSGGAYVVSDKDENGNFIMYTKDTTHVWATEFDGKLNRWVAYCFATENHDFQITDTNTSPRSIFIGRKVGVITCLTNSRCSQITVPDGNQLESIDYGSYSQNFGRSIVIRNINKLSSKLGGNSTVVELVYLQGNELDFNNGTYPLAILPYYENLNTLLLSFKNIGLAGITAAGNNFKNLKQIIIDGIENCSGRLSIGGSRDVYEYPSYLPALRNIYIINTEELVLRWSIISDETFPTNFTYIYIGYKTNDKTKSIGFNTGPYKNKAWIYIQDAELQNGWCKPLDIQYFTALTETNIYSHILQRLKQDEPNCGDGVTITLGATNLAKLTSQESQDLLASLRGTYGYTFA